MHDHGGIVVVGDMPSDFKNLSFTRSWDFEQNMYFISFTHV